MASDLGRRRPRAGYPVREGPLSKMFNEVRPVYRKRVREWMHSREEESNNEDEEQIKKKTKKNQEETCLVDRSSSSSSSIVDDELLVFQILNRLPVKSLMRFKSVCKGWKSIIERDSHLVNLHHTHSESRPGLLIVVAPYDSYTCCDDNISIRAFGLISSRISASGKPSTLSDDDNLRRGYDLSFLSAGLHTSDGIVNFHSVRRIQSSVTCLGPVRGLLCLVDLFAVQICNVSTGEVSPWIQSNAEKLKSWSLYPEFFEPHHSRSPQYFFGFDPSSGKHKVLCLWWSFEPELAPHCEVLTVGDDSYRWRIIDAVPPFKPCSRTNISAYANGSIYWFRRDSILRSGVRKYSASLMAFDFGSEKFRMIQIPKFTHLVEDTTKSSEEMAISKRYQRVTRQKFSHHATTRSCCDGLIEMDGCLTAIRRRYQTQTVQMFKFRDSDKENGMPATAAGSKKDWTEVDIKLPSDITSDVFIYFHPVPGKGQLILETYAACPIIETGSDQRFKRNVKFARFYSYNLTNKTFSRLRIKGISSVPENCTTTFATLVESLLSVGEKLQDL